MSKKDWFGVGVALMFFGGNAFLLKLLGFQWDFIDIFGGSWEVIAGLMFVSGAVVTVYNKDK